jgi:NADH:ubiquinone oxidoreductase subunit F (NADH-binding)
MVAGAGTKVISLSSDIAHGYTVEVPFGTTLNAVIEETGGGVPAGRTLKAVQFGGPTGAYFGDSDVSAAIDYDTLHAADRLWARELS